MRPAAFAPPILRPRDGCDLENLSVGGAEGLAPPPLRPIGRSSSENAPPLLGPAPAGGLLRPTRRGKGAERLTDASRPCKTWRPMSLPEQQIALTAVTSRTNAASMASASKRVLTLGIRVGEEEIAKIDAIAQAQQIPPDRTSVARVALQRGLDDLLAEIQGKTSTRKGTKRP